MKHGNYLKEKNINKKNLKSEKGSVTLFVLVAMLFFVMIAVSLYMKNSNKIQSQNAEIKKIQNNYYEDSNEIYNNQVSIKTKYIVSFDANGGNILSDEDKVKDVIYKNKYEKLPMPTRVGYKFNGWYTLKSGGKEITEDTTVEITSNQILYAQWSANIYMIVYDGNGATSGSMDPGAYCYGAYYNLNNNNYSKTGYDFTGWNTNKDGTGTSYSNGQNIYNVATEGTITLYAQWKGEYTIIFDANGGIFEDGTTTKSKPVTVNSEGKITIPNEVPTMSGYKFQHYDVDPEVPIEGYGVGEEYNITDLEGYMSENTITLYARWTINVYTVTFNANNGSVSPTSKNVTYGNIYGTLPIATRTGYTFNGWYTAISGGTQITSSSKVTITSNQTLYAQWKTKTVTINYNMNGGTDILESDTFTYSDELNQTIELKENKPRQLKDHLFCGWGLTATGNEVGIQDEDGYTCKISELSDNIIWDKIGNTGSIMLYAQWKECNVEFWIKEGVINGEGVKSEVGENTDGWFIKDKWDNSINTTIKIGVRITSDVGQMETYEIKKLNATALEEETGEYVSCYDGNYNEINSKEGEFVFDQDDQDGIYKLTFIAGNINDEITATYIVRKDWYNCAYRYVIDDENATIYIDDVVGLKSVGVLATANPVDANIGYWVHNYDESKLLRLQSVKPSKYANLSSNQKVQYQFNGHFYLATGHGDTTYEIEFETLSGKIYNNIDLGRFYCEDDNEPDGNYDSGTFEDGDWNQDDNYWN